MNVPFTFEINIQFPQHRARVSISVHTHVHTMHMHAYKHIYTHQRIGAATLLARLNLQIAIARDG